MATLTLESVGQTDTCLLDVADMAYLIRMKASQDSGYFVGEFGVLSTFQNVGSDAGHLFTCHVNPLQGHC